MLDDVALGDEAGKFVLLPLGEAFLEGYRTCHDVVLGQAALLEHKVYFRHTRVELHKSFEQIFTPFRVLARRNSLRIQDDEQIFFQVLVVSLARVVAAEGLDKSAVNGFLIDLLFLLFFFFKFLLTGFFLSLAIITVLVFFIASVAIFSGVVLCIIFIIVCDGARLTFLVHVEIFLCLGSFASKLRYDSVI